MKSNRFICLICFGVISNFAGYLGSWASDERIIPSNDQTYTLAIDFPDVIRSGYFYNVAFRILCSKDRDCEEIKSVAVTASMPHHGHGTKYKIVVGREASGFLLEGLNFHMKGFWHIYFDVEGSLGLERIQFDVEV